ncbi:MAG: hypothetical protein AAGF83_26090 [Cyanobacteria bacterium P01_G01_bin.67]
MNTSTKSLLLGEILQNAGLISNVQIQIVLHEHRQNFKLRFGEVLAAKGWVKQQTANFFADEWNCIIQQQERYPLGYYLEKSGLLTKEQVSLILQEQRQIWVKFGSVAILQGLLVQQTVDFFLNNLSPLSLCCSPLIGRKNFEVKKVQNTQIIDESSSSELDYEDIPWID